MSNDSRTGFPVVPEAPASPATAVVAGFGDPAGLGLGAFALTTFVLSVVNAGWVAGGAVGAVLGLALFYGGVAQLFAGMWEFANRNTFGAVAFSSYGAFWLSFWYLETFVKLPGSDAGAAVGLYLLAWGIFTLYMTIAAFRTNWIVFFVFVFLTLTYFALAFGDFAGVKGLSMLGGYLGILTALLAWYGSFATVTNFTFKRIVLPVGPASK
ncbi:acetate uptake transporter [Microbacterium sp. STN6]|uniref:acetate uptake transporter n=1 Tax=Microbacterium sp. STN6 TaxID=2995588 RepID=UPI002260E59E|nr:acetate uptake transporter [Microbacterium sp. STN6]MCX7523279.1 acetate uptake transporter [Microbacterium sp. STN6]